VVEDVWRKRVRERIAREIAEEKNLQANEPDHLALGSSELAAPHKQLTTAMTASAAGLAGALAFSLFANAIGVVRKPWPFDIIHFFLRRRKLV
jgi:hypothetical protein